MQHILLSPDLQQLRRQLICAHRSYAVGCRVGPTASNWNPCAACKRSKCRSFDRNPANSSIYLPNPPPKPEFAMSTPLQLRKHCCQERIKAAAPKSIPSCVISPVVTDGDLNSQLHSLSLQLPASRWLTLDDIFVSEQLVREERSQCQA